MSKYRVTQSLLSSFDWGFITENGWTDFLNTLKREKKEQNQAMLNGIKFENMVTDYCEKGILDEEHKWSNSAKEIGDIVKGGMFQVALSRDIEIDDMNFHLYGILDNLKAGIIYDIKFSKKYEFGKYLDSPQHPMYFELCPEANTFIYLVSNGKEVFKEVYHREDTRDIKENIKAMIAWLKKLNLIEEYKKYWESKY